MSESEMANPGCTRDIIRPLEVIEKIYFFSDPCAGAAT